MKYSQAIQNAQSILDVVAVINHGGTAYYSSNEIAGHYAYSASAEAGYDIDAASIEAHLDYLARSGAYFDYSSARAVAMGAR